MALDKFLLAPDAPSYTVTDGMEAIRTQLDGGAGRYRKDVLNATYTVKASWTFTRTQFNYWRSFYKVISESGSMPFLIDLMTDTSLELEEHTAYIVPGSVVTSQIQGHSFKVECNLEVVPVNHNEDGFFELTLILYEMFGDDMYNPDNTDYLDELFDQFAYLMTVELPSFPAWEG